MSANYETLHGSLYGHAHGGNNGHGHAHGQHGHGNNMMVNLGLDLADHGGQTVLQYVSQGQNNQRTYNV